MSAPEPVKKIVVTLADGTERTFTGERGHLTFTDTYVKNTEGKQHRTIKLVELSMVLSYGEWVARPKP